MGMDNTVVLRGPSSVLALCTVDFLTNHLSSYSALKDVVSMTIPADYGRLGCSAVLYTLFLATQQVHIF